MQRPVIIVPAMQVPGNLSLENIRDFLENGVYSETGSQAEKERLQNAST